MLAAPDDDGSGGVAGGQQALVAVKGHGQHCVPMALQGVDGGTGRAAHVEEMHAGVFAARHWEWRRGKIRSGAALWLCPLCPLIARYEPTQAPWRKDISGQKQLRSACSRCRVGKLRRRRSPGAPEPSSSTTLHGDKRQPRGSGPTHPTRLPSQPCRLPLQPCPTGPHGCPIPTASSQEVIIAPSPPP